MIMPGQFRGAPKKNIVGLAEFCEETGQDIHRAVEVMQVLADEEVFELAKHEAAVAQCNGNPRKEARPLEDEGHEWARVEARIPARHFFNFLQNPNFGYEGLTSPDGMKDILKAYPQFGVKTVSGKVQGIGFGAGPRNVVKRY